MAWGIVDSVSVNCTSPGGDGQPTADINTTGASLIFAFKIWYSNEAEPVLEDSFDNTWIPLDAHTVTSKESIRIHYCENPIVGSGHNFTAVGTGDFPSLGIIALSGAKISDV